MYRLRKERWRKEMRDNVEKIFEMLNLKPGEHFCLSGRYYENTFKLREFYLDKDLRLYELNHNTGEWYINTITFRNIICGNYEIIKKMVLPTQDKDVLKFLKMYSYEFKYLARDEDNSLWAYTLKPVKVLTGWSTDWSDRRSVRLPEETFSFVKWEDKEPFSIKDLL